MKIRACISPLILALTISMAVAEDPGEVPVEVDPSLVPDPIQRVEHRESLPAASPHSAQPAGHWVDLVQPGDFPHSIRVPGTSLSLKLGGFFKGDAIHDFDAIGSTDNFATLTIPTDGRDGENTRLHARQTRLNLDVRMPTSLGTAKLFVEGDYFGPASTWRLRHAFAELGPLIVGQTWTTFTHIEALPETVDFESPGAFILTRRGMVRWTARPTDRIALAMAIEDPTFTIPNPADLPLVPLTGGLETPWPDFVGHVRYTSERCQFQFAGIIRTVAFRVTGDDSSESSTGYGLNWSGVFDLNERNRVTFLAGFGEGVAGLRGRTDGTPTPDGDIDLADVFIGNIGYRLKWTDKWRSTIVYSQGRRNNTFFETNDAFRKTQYFAVNLIWTPVQRIDMGVEYLFGTREDKDGSRGEANRIQFGFWYRLP